MERRVASAVPALMYRATTEADGWNFAAVCGGLLERLDVSPDDLCADPGQWILMVHRADRARVIAERRRATTSGRFELEYRLRTPGYDVCWVHDVAVADDGGMSGVVVDLTEHRRAAEVLEKLYDARLDAVDGLVRASAVRATTVQLFVHDLRSPLTAVAGLSRRLQERGDGISAEDRDRILHRMAGASERILALVDDFACFWDQRLDDVAVAVRPVALCSLVRLAVDEVGEDERVRVDVDETVVETNPELLGRVVVGLLRNAVQHTPPDTMVRLSVAAEDGCVILEVEDDGPGIPSHLRDCIFEPRVRGTDEHGGMGMGLALVRSAVELLGGHVEMDEGASGGTVVRVELPRSPSGIVVDTDTPCARSTQNPVGPAHGRRWGQSSVVGAGGL